MMGFLNAIKATASQDAAHVHFVGTISDRTQQRPNGITRHYPSRALDGLVESASQFAGRLDTYVAPAYFEREWYWEEYQDKKTGETKRRKRWRTEENALGASCFWVDIDCGADKAAEGKGYIDRKAAIDALVEWYKAVGLDKPNVLVNSGGGIHAYWTFERFIEKAEWKALAESLKALTQNPGGDIKPLRADGSRTADIASFMRMPGTTHLKDPSDPKPVEVLRILAHLDFDKFAARLREAAPGRATSAGEQCELDDLGAGMPTSKGQPCMKLECTPENVAFVLRALEAARLSQDTARGEWMPTVWSIMSLGEGWQDVARDWSRQSSRYSDAGFDNVAGSYEEGKSGFEHVLRLARANGFTEQAPVGGAKPARATYLGDIKTAAHFASAQAGRLLYIADRKVWARWDGVAWVDCERNEHFEAAKEVASQIASWAYQKCAAAPDDAELRKKTNRLIGRVMSQGGVAAMVQLASSDPRIVAASSDFDADPDLLCVQNGYVDLRTGQHFAPDPGKRMKRRAAAKFDPTATCPRWDQFLAEIFQGDIETVEFIQRAVGYSITGHAGEEKLFICYGAGANGKSIFADTITRIMDDYVSIAPPSLLVHRGNQTGPNEELARLNGARIVQINELQSGDKLNEQTVKLLAGREKLSARYLYGSYVDFWPSFSPWLRTNHRPIVVGDDHGIWRRLVLIPFARKFELHEQDGALETKLLAERDGILKWAIEGAVKWARDGLRIPASIQRESAAYRKESDILGQFLDERTRPDPNGRVRQNDLWVKWQMHCEADGIASGSKNSFSRRLGERGYGKQSSNSNHFYTGLVMRSDPDTVA